MQHTKVIFHGTECPNGKIGGCTDGFGAALAAWLVKGDCAEYFPVNYGRELDEISKVISENDEVYILDLNCTREQLKCITSAAGTRGKVIVIDHHKDSIDQLMKPSLEDLALSDRVIDGKQSGAMLTWKYFLPGKVPPALFEVLQRRDLWQDDTPEWSDNQIAFSGIQTIDRFFSEWQKYLLDLTVNELVELGRPFYEERQRKIMQLVEAHVMISIMGERIPAAYADSAWSEVAQELARMYDAPFALCWRNDPNDETIRIWEVRSLKGTKHSGNAHAFASLMGGGGHPNAAGFRLPKSQSISIDGLIITATKDVAEATLKMVRDFSEQETSTLQWDQFFLSTQNYRGVCRTIDAGAIEGLRVLRDYYHCIIEVPK